MIALKNKERSLTLLYIKCKQITNGFIHRHNFKNSKILDSATSFHLLYSKIGGGEGKLL